MMQKGLHFSGLDLNIDCAPRTVFAVPAAESIDAPRPVRLCAADAPLAADHGGFIRVLVRKGHSVRFADGPYGGYQAIMVNPDGGYVGASESRKDGQAAGY